MRYPGYFLGRQDRVYSTAILLVAFGFAYFGCLEAMTGSQGPSTPDGSFGREIASTILCQVGSLLLFFFVLWERGSGLKVLGFSLGWKDLLGSIQLYFFGYVPTLVLTGVVALVWIHFAGNSADLKPTGELRQMTDGLGTLPLSLVSFYLFVNAFFEEGIIRVFFMDQMGKVVKGGSFLVFLSALVQAGYHAYQGWFRATMIFVLFLFFAAYYQRYRRATPLVLAHFFVDESSVLLLRLIAYLKHYLPTAG